MVWSHLQCVQISPSHYIHRAEGLVTYNPNQFWIHQLCRENQGQLNNWRWAWTNDLPGSHDQHNRDCFQDVLKGWLALITGNLIFHRCMRLPVTVAAMSNSIMGRKWIAVKRKLGYFLNLATIIANVSYFQDALITGNLISHLCDFVGAVQTFQRQQCNQIMDRKWIAVKRKYSTKLNHQSHH